MFIDFRLKFRHFIKKNSKIIAIVAIIWVIVFIVNRILKNYEAPKQLQTTYTPHRSIMDDSNVPKTVANPIEDMIEQYVGFCNDADWQAAYNMLSDDCKKYAFEDNIENFMEYVYTKMPTQKKYAIQDYSNKGNTYVYQIKYTDDILASGLTNTTYSYTEEKMIFKKQKDGTIDMSVGNYIEHRDIKNISENEYLKVDVKSVTDYYSVEKYYVKLTNRSNYTIVIADGYGGTEVGLILKSGDIRNCEVDSLVLDPGKSVNVTFAFTKFEDNSDDAQSLIFDSVRVMEHYSGKEVDKQIIESEIQNAIAKFSVSIPVTSKK